MTAASARPLAASAFAAAAVFVPGSTRISA
jgi:hypothetical protein